VEKDVILPRLEHKVIYLEPCFYDKLTINLFILFLTANAVTSERTDVDYLFHKNSQKSLYVLIKNLRQSNFFWSGWCREDIINAISHSLKYLQEQDSQKPTNCSRTDRILLNQCVNFGETVIRSRGWNEMSVLHELGLFVDGWPDDSIRHWSMTGDDLPAMVGATQLIKAQKHVDNQLSLDNPTLGLKEEGIATLKGAYADATPTTLAENARMKMGVPTSGLRSGDVSHTSPKKTSRESKPTVMPKPISNETTPLISSIQAKDVVVDSESDVAKPAIVGTTSSKMSYLLERVMTLHSEEKILIFYDAVNTAWYIAQCLELLHIKHLIYAKTLTPEQRSRWIVAFDTDDSIRVLLMDIESGALGLNVNKASRVFFVNPALKPHQEAQAIKRAHRIGQSRPVYVETLILHGTIEEAMFNRSKAMTREEHVNAEKEILNDQGVARIIQTAEILAVNESDGTGWGQMAPIKVPLQVFGRSGRGNTKIEGIDLEGEERRGPKRKRKSTAGGASKTKRAKGATPSVSHDGVGSIFG
jgi:SNF2 family DNA or RNA helicase